MSSETSGRAPGPHHAGGGGRGDGAREGSCHCGADGTRYRARPMSVATSRPGRRPWHGRPAERARWRRVEPVAGRLPAGPVDGPGPHHPHRLSARWAVGRAGRAGGVRSRPHRRRRRGAAADARSGGPRPVAFAGGHRLGRARSRRSWWARCWCWRSRILAAGGDQALLPSLEVAYALVLAIASLSLYRGPGRHARRASARLARPRPAGPCRRHHGRHERRPRPS